MYSLKSLFNDKKKILVVGSGLAAYGACKALINRPDIEIELCDIGLRSAYKNQPNKIVPNAKDCNSSFYAYGLNDFRWNVNLISERICSSHAYGGFSKVWSGSILRPRDEDLVDWPLESIPSDSDYSEIIKSLNVYCEKDELNDLFPLNGIQKIKNPDRKIYIGKSRIALAKIKDQTKNRKAIPFDSSRIFSEWIEKKLIKYFGDTRLIYVRKIENILEAHFDNLGSKIIKKYDQIFLGAGCVNTTAIVDRSLYRSGTRIYKLKLVPHLVQGLLKIPLINSEYAEKLGMHDDYGLTRFFLESKNRNTGNFWSHTQIGPINKLIIKRIFRKENNFIYTLLSSIFSVFRFSLTLFHSNLREEVTMKISTKNEKNSFSQTIQIEENDYSCSKNMYRSTKLALLSKFFRLGLIPIPFSLWISKVLLKNSLGIHHFGGSLPMSKFSRKKSYCNPSGELFNLKGTFVIDTSSFPSIPGSTIGLLTMANAYRIAKKSI